MKPEVTAFFDEDTNTVTYVVRDPGSNICAVIDPVLDFDPASGRTSTRSADLLLVFINDNGLKPAWILETHVHADHLSAASYLKSKTGGKTGNGRFITCGLSTCKDIFKIGDDFVPNGEQID